MLLKTRHAETMCVASRPAVATYLLQIDRHPEAVLELDTWTTRIEQIRLRSARRPDDFFDDLFVLDRCVDFLAAYARVWRLVAQSQFTESWDALQDSLDLLRLIKRLSVIDVSCFEDQLVELERAYPYNVFFSIGAVVTRFECSLCAEDMDSLACPHRRGHLYRGRMAQAVAKEIVELDHISMVDQPQDKRCVVSYENTAPQFSVVRALGQLITSSKMRVSQFSHLVFSKRRFLNPGHRQIGRNERCYCDSGLKFKHCCVDKALEEQDHVDIIARAPTEMASLRV